MSLSRKRQKPSRQFKKKAERVVLPIMETLAGKAKKPKLHRPGITLDAKVEALLAQGVVCSCGCGEVIRKGEGEFDHSPALELRAYDPITKKYSPDANDPKFLGYRKNEHHKTKTHGPGGEKRITAKGGDNHTRQHTDANSKSHREYLDRMAKLGKPVPPRRY